MAKQSKFFRVAKAGATTDGRKISPEWIEQMAKNYNPAVYQARISIEHIKGLHPNSDFRNMGDVLALKTEKKGKDFYLLAQIAPTDELVAYTKAKQKNFTSIEVNPSFADTGEAYLVGLAVTDNPASLGTDYLEFAAKNTTANIYAARKTDPQNIITEAVEFTAQWEEVADPPPKKNRLNLARYWQKSNNYARKMPPCVNQWKRLKPPLNAWKKPRHRAIKNARLSPVKCHVITTLVFNLKGSYYA
ncbi:GPO family capsid scaffolding protein [Rodentibacter caecimuris]|uniref:GPO family capsid scaffolding protein n=1 Tax=Rodentibacter caecimuris TaxID=1796644 RepID=UPI0013A09675|nr:GPO family capsid scaffolding protein [Rodentibacter heylii]QIA76059.1 GPO family capsid scaffolding protein [Rodentibacter heylii]